MNALVPQGPFVLDGLLWRAEHLVLPWMSERIDGMQGLEFGSPDCPAYAFGVLRGSNLVGGVAFAQYRHHPEGGDVQVSVVMEPGARVTRRMWRHLYGYGFNQLGCRRMSMQTTKGNKAAREHAARMGWRLEGCKQEALGRKDLLQYGLLRSTMRDGLPPMKKGRHHG
jgi:RimJ/RimL family protein N-acetyltransferase